MLNHSSDLPVAKTAEKRPELEQGDSLCSLPLSPSTGRNSTSVASSLWNEEERLAFGTVKSMATLVLGLPRRKLFWTEPRLQSPHWRGQGGISEDRGPTRSVPGSVPTDRQRHALTFGLGFATFKTSA